MSRPTREQAEEAVRTLLLWAGDDPSREGLRDTPARVARMYEEVFAGLRMEPPRMTAFTMRTDQMIVMGNLAFSSFCEHHLVPFVGYVDIGVLPDEDAATNVVLGASKYARLVDWVAARPSVQETMTSTIADMLKEITGAQGVIVVARASHECMACRGVKKSEARMITSCIRGHIDKMEFFRLLAMNGHR